jgi:hypothetical protein
MKLTLWFAIGWLAACPFFAGCQCPGNQRGRDSRGVGLLREELGAAPGRVHTYYRGNDEVLAEYVLPDGRRCRLFSQSGQRVLAESDEDGDGFMETITLFPNDLLTAEIFRRDPDGHVRPIGSSELEHFRAKAGAAFTQFLDAQLPARQADACR